MIKAISPSLDTTLNPPTAVQRLGRFFAIEKALLRIQAARLPDLRSWNLKHRVGYHLFADAEHAQALLIRRRELPGGVRPPASVDPHLRSSIEACLFVEGDYGYCSALYLGVKSLLVQAYRHHLEHTVPASDDRSRQVLEAIIADEERQIAWVHGALALMPEVRGGDKRQAREAIEQVQQWIGAAGGLLGEGPVTPDELPEPRSYTVVKDARREPRQRATLEFEAPTVAGDAIQQAVVTQFTSFFREMAAAETVASMLWDAPDSMPWEFFVDTARHCWDEIRHSQAGQERLERLGLDIWSVPVQTGNYDIRSRMPLLERYAYITQVEEGRGFARRHEREALFRDAGDQLSADMMAYDTADERRHVAFGSKWIPELQKVIGDTRSMATLVEDATRLRQSVLAALHARTPEDGSY